MLIITCGIFFNVTKSNKYNQTFLHLLALENCFVTDDACSPYGMDAKAVSRIRSLLWQFPGESPLNIKDIEFLSAEHDFDIDKQDSFGATALHYAAMCNTGICHWLLKNGASPYVVDNGGWNILHYAAAAGRLDQYWDEATSINKYVDFSRLINQQDKDGSTPLHIAVSGGSGNRLLLILLFPNDLTVKWLLDHGADASIRDNGFWRATPADYARMNNFKTILTLLEP